ncbi:hypothetical protein CVT25_015891 [Psilocybe cyanescens]|uniref:Uncharacterized protein n=1 Tax=Psilocybe cyanescens TaxID=93625 RepID=A0A409WS71_PSICY|nr:hypothetical protein CVT25_015891 [Psilocybe cyanescens]
MPGQLLEQGTGTELLLQKLVSRETIILADTLHLETISMNDPDGTVLNLQKVFQAVTERKLDFQVWAATKIVLDRWRQEKSATSTTRTREEHVVTAIEQLFFELGMEMRDRAPGPHIALIDPRNHNDTSALVVSAQRTYALFRKNGVKKEDIMISIPATEAGIRATKHLQTMEDKIKVNLYMVTSLMHTAACVEANATMITVPVGPLLKIFEDRQRTLKNASSCHSGVEEIQSMFEYLKKKEIRTKAIGTSFRNMTELGLLSDFFAVCVSPEQIQRLKGGARVPITSLKGSSDIAKQRGQEAKYPTSLLTKEGGAWFSGASRSVINGVLFLALTEMKQEMELIEHYVEQEVIQQFELDALHLSTVYRQQDWAEKILKETENNSVLDTSVDEPRNEAHGADLEKISRKSHPTKLEQDVDDIF